MSYKILIVDDDAEFRSALSMLLGDLGYDIAVTWNGRAALDHLRSHAPPDVILLDLEMPVMDGYAFCVEKRRDGRLAGVPIVLISGHPDLGERVRPEGVTEWLRKPVDIAAIVRTIRRLTSANGDEASAQEVA